MNRSLLAATACATLVAGTRELRAASIPVPNGSFESPVAIALAPTVGAVPFVDDWQQVPAPDTSNPETFLTGVFTNSTQIVNCDGTQAAFLFAEPYVSLFQDYDSTDYAHPEPTHAFDAAFEPGKSYTLTVGVLGGTNLTEPMPEGTTLQLSLYYRDSSNQMETVAATTVTNIYALFPMQELLDFQLQVPTVKASDPWAGQHIGIQLLSTVTSPQSGYWDLDNVRLASTVTPALVSPVSTNGRFSFTLQSETGLVFEILASTNVGLALSNWTSLGTITNVAGTTPFSDPAGNLSRRFYRARQVL